MKFCHICGAQIRLEAEICPKCGVRQAYVQHSNVAPDEDVRNQLKTLLLISAISNIVVGVIWLATLIGVIFTIPMIILCVFEFKLWSDAEDMPLHELVRRASSLYIFEIIVGLANLPTLVCGIILGIRTSKLKRQWTRRPSFYA